MAGQPRTRPATGRKARAGEKQDPPRLRDGEVMDVAARVFARRGYADATIQDVADELGMLKGSIYYYIRSKEELLFRLINGLHDDVDLLLEEVIAVPGLDPVDRLCEYVRRQAVYNVRNLIRVSVYYNDLDRLGDDRRKQIVARRKLHEDFVVDQILAGQRQGLIDDERNAKLLAYNVFAILIWPYRWFRPHGRIKVSDVAESCVTFVRAGLAIAG